MKTSTIFKLAGILVILFLMNRCTKEELQINNSDLNELDKSYYVPAERTIILPETELSALVMSKDSLNLVLSDNEMFSGLRIGDCIISDINTPYEDMIFREIVGIEKVGGQIHLETKGAALTKAFSEYHFDSNFPQTIGVRDDLLSLENITSSASSTLTSIFANLDKNGGWPFRVEPKLVLTGFLEYRLSHINTMWKYRDCNESDKSKCFDPDLNPQNIVDVDTNGIYDVAEEWYFNEGGLEELIEYGFYDMIVTDFGIKDMALKFTTKKDRSSEVKFEDKAADVAREMLLTPTSIKENADLDLNYTYKSVPVGWGFGVAFVTGFLHKYVWDAKYYAGVEWNLPNRLDMRLGYIDYLNDSDGDFLLDFRWEKNGIERNFTELFTNGQVNGMVGAQGTGSANVGLAAGVGLTFGEPGTIGTAVGAMVEPTLYAKIKGDFGVVVSDIFSSKQPVSLDVVGNLCLDFGLSVDSYFFTDANFYGFDRLINPLFDNKIRPKINNLLPYQVSFINFLNENSNGLTENQKKSVSISNKDGLCIGLIQTCNEVAFTQSDIYLNEDFTVDLNWEVRSQNFNSYRLFIQNGPEQNEIGVFDFNTSYFQPVQLSPEVYAGLQNQTLTLYIEVEDGNCSATSPFLVTFADCPSQTSTDPSIASPILELGTNFIQYFTLSDAAKACANDGGKRIVTWSEANQLISDGKCLNPTGFYIDGKYGNRDKFYSWIANQDGNNISYSLIEVDLGFDGEQIIINGYREQPTNISTLAPCLCID